MAVLTGAIEADGGAEVARVIAAVLVGTVTVMTAEATSTVEVAVEALVLDHGRHMMIDTIGPQDDLDVMIVRMINNRAEKSGSVAKVLRDVVKPPDPT